MDGRVNNGGKRPGAGRPKKAEENKLIERLDAIIDSDVVIQKLLELSVDGDMRAIKLYMEYRFGKPKETVHNTHEVHQSINNIRELYGAWLAD